jgi:NAD(P)H dehydrogenase (quinone)
MARGAARRELTFLQRGWRMKVLVAYYSRYGHVLKLARAVAKGAESVEGVEAVLRRAAEFPDAEEEIKRDEYALPVWKEQQGIGVCTLDDLRQADAVVWGTPTRFGNMAAQMKRIFDSAAPLWLEGALEGKPTGVFTSTATTHGGQETTILATMIPLLHLGMIFVGVPYSTPGMLHTEGRGGTPYGPSTVAGSSNELQPTAEDLGIAEALGRRVAEVAMKLRG